MMQTDVAGAELINSDEDFTLNLYKSLANESDGNIVTSTFSANMVPHGTLKKNKNVLTKVHEYPVKSTQVYQSNHSLLHTLHNEDDMTFNIAIKTYANKLKFKDSFKRITNTHFWSPIELIDFSNNQKAAEIMNQWCAQKTNNRIRKIVNKRDIDKYNKLILLNLVYFKCIWDGQFTSKFTSYQPFYLSSTNVLQISTICFQFETYYKYFEELDAECVVLQLKNKNMYMLILIPREIDGLDWVEKNLDTFQIEYTELVFSEKEGIELHLPEFKSDTTIDFDYHLKEEATKFRTKQTFEPVATFGGDDNKVIMNDKAIHKVCIEVDEESVNETYYDGCYAAFQYLMSVVPIVERPEPKVVRVNRPFFYKIMHLNASVFLGRVKNPLETDYHT